MKNGFKVIAFGVITLAVLSLLIHYNRIDKEKINISTITSTSVVPDFSPKSENLTYEEILLKEEYSQLYPRGNFEGMELVLSVNYLYDEIANPKAEICLNTIWENELKEIAINIVENKENVELADTSKVERYKLLYESDIRYDEETGEYSHKVYFKPEDITLEVIKNRIIETTQGKYKKMSDISVVFDSYIVTYQCRSNEINEKDILELITSAEYFSD